MKVQREAGLKVAQRTAGRSFITRLIGERKTDDLSMWDADNAKGLFAEVETTEKGVYPDPVVYLWDAAAARLDVAAAAPSIKLAVSLCDYDPCSLVVAAIPLP